MNRGGGDRPPHEMLAAASTVSTKAGRFQCGQLGEFEKGGNVTRRTELSRVDILFGYMDYPWIKMSAHIPWSAKKNFGSKVRSQGYY